MDSFLEFKSLRGEIKDLDFNGRIVTGYLASFGTEDLGGDTIEPGAFKKTLAERKDSIFFLNQHRWAEPHGKFRVLEEKQQGLYFESNPLANTTYSDDVLKLYEAGIMNEHSIGFLTMKSRIPKKGKRILTEIKLYEGSNVTMGMHPNTPFLGLKSTIKEVNDQSNLIYKAIRNGTFTDETFSLLELALKQLQNQAFILGQKSLNEPSNDTVEPIEALRSFNKKLNI